jgi:glycosyltransferase involved in cell wall biosynthesis
MHSGEFNVPSGTNMPIKVAIIVGKMSSGGKKSLTMEYFRHIDQNEIQFHFICDSDSQNVPENEIRERGGKLSYITPYQNITMNILDLYRLCKRERFDIMHAYNSTMNVFSLLAGKMAGVPVRISESLSMAHKSEPKTYIKNALRPASKLYATHYMACGEDCGRWQFGDTLFDRGEVTVFKTAIDANKNAYDPEARDKARKELGLDRKFVVGHIGRFVPQKNPLFLLRVFKEIYTQRHDAVLLLIGDGPLREEMLAQIESDGIADVVCYLGLREDIIQFYQAMDCFLLPSLYEGLPVVGLEAQCAGLPIFFSDTVSREVVFSPMTEFVDLKASEGDWANRIVLKLKEAPRRTSYSSQAIEAGFDSAIEGKRLADYYLEKKSS